MAFGRAVSNATATSADFEDRALLHSLEASAACLPDVDSYRRNTLDFADFRHGKMVVRSRQNKMGRTCANITVGRRYSIRCIIAGHQVKRKNATTIHAKRYSRSISV